MDIFEILNYKLSEAKKFYFFDYFYVLLKSTQKFDDEERVFQNFQYLKEALNLGESRYKKIGSISDKITNKQLTRYKYTFQEVVEESQLLGIIHLENGKKIKLTELGNNLLSKYENSNPESFIEQLFFLIESKSYGFHYLISSLYKENPTNGGTLIFPIYSPLKLHFSKEDLLKNNKFIEYLNTLKTQLELDINNHLKKQINLHSANEDLIDRLVEIGLLTKEYDLINNDDYNLVLKRIRDYWLNHFLKNVYNFKLITSVSYFDLWTYRAKQIGLLNVTEFYPGVSGKMVYPTSILYGQIKAPEFRKLFEYPNEENLYLHDPKFNENFVSTLFESYLELKRSYSSYFVNLADLREIVCFKLKISYRKFVTHLDKAYELNLQGRLSISISLEADKLPSENAIYLKRDPIYILNKLKNIIAIELNTTRNE